MQIKFKNFFSNLTKYLPFIGLSLAGQNYLMAMEARRARLQGVSNEVKILLEELQAKKELIINNEMTHNRILELTFKAQNDLVSANKSNKFIKELLLRLEDPNITPNEREFINNLINNTFDDQLESTEMAYTSLQKLLEAINSDNSVKDFINQSDIINIIDRYKDFLSTLRIEQIVPVANICGLITILACFISIVIVFYSDYLIKYFKFEEKYPRIRKYIELRRKFQ